MQAIVIAGDLAFYPDDVEIWVVTDEEANGIMEEEIRWQDVEPEKSLNLDNIANEILID